MKTRRAYTKKTLIIAMLLLCAILLSACGDAYTKYSAAYKKISANGGINANITTNLTMDGETKTYSGNMKIDNKNNLLYYEMSSDGNTTTQFSDGSYLYVDRGSEKIKYSLSGGKPSDTPSQQSGGKPEETPTFSSTDFLNQFASFLDAGKIKELGLLDPMNKTAVTKTSQNGNTYTLEVSDAVVKKFLNTMAVNESGSSETVQITDLKNFKYTATVKNDIVTGVTYAGDVSVNVPASIMSSGSAADYSLSLDIKIDFVDPGSAVTVTLPATDEFKEVSGF